MLNILNLFWINSMLLLLLFLFVYFTGTQWRDRNKDGPFNSFLFEQNSYISFHKLENFREFNLKFSIW